jgi:hypothetical protein
LIGGQSIGVDPNIDGAFKGADDLDFAYSGRAFELDLHDLVSNFAQLANAALAGKGHDQDGRQVVVSLGDDGWIGFAGQVSDYSGDAVADILGGGINIPV